jgi:cupin superfamily acireductone dioxygenase involved in methionine salvage
MFSATGFQCDVTLFHDSYSPKTDIVIVQLATAHQHENGIVYYLVTGESLWFGDDMEHSPFNRLIANDVGVNLCTDPYD